MIVCGCLQVGVGCLRRRERSGVRDKRLLRGRQRSIRRARRVDLRLRFVRVCDIAYRGNRSNDYVRKILIGAILHLQLDVKGGRHECPFVGVGGRDYLHLGSIFPRPAGWDAAHAIRPCGGAVGEKGTRGGHAVEPVIGAEVGANAACGQTGHRAQAGAVAEHVVVAAIGQSGGGQRGGRRQDAAVFEHAFVAVLGQRDGGQLRGRRQGGAAAEHEAVAVLGQRRGGQQQAARVGQRGVAIEKTIEDKLLARQRGRLVVCLVNETHDVAVHLRLRRSQELHLRAIAIDLCTGAVAVELHLVALRHVDGRRGVDKRLGAAVHRVLHACRKRIVHIHLDSAVCQRLHRQRRGQRNGLCRRFLGRHALDRLFAGVGDGYLCARLGFGRAYRPVRGIFRAFDEGYIVCPCAEHRARREQYCHQFRFHLSVSFLVKFSLHAPTSAVGAKTGRPSFSTAVFRSRSCAPG